MVEVKKLGILAGVRSTATTVLEYAEIRHSIRGAPQRYGQTAYRSKKCHDIVLLQSQLLCKLCR